MSSSEQEPTQEWSSRPFEDFTNYVQTIVQVLHLTIQGISTIPARPQAVRALADYYRSKNGHIDERQDLEIAEMNAALARREIDSGFALVHAQAAVSLWGGLEDLVRTFTAQWILHRPETLRQEPFASFKIKLGEYEASDREQRAYYLAELLEQSLAAPLKLGVTRFESIFTALGLPGALDESIKRTLYELQQIRNVIVHKRAIADRKLCDACPWLGLSAGVHVTVTHAMLHSYTEALGGYATELIYRMGDFFGRPIRPTPNPSA